MTILKNKKRGFTIVELLIVIVIIGILAAITIVAYNGITARARDSQRLKDAKTIMKTLELYHIDNGGYPRCTGGTHTPGMTQTSGYATACLEAAFVPKYMSKFPVDPVNTGDKVYNYGSGYRKTGPLTHTSDLSDNYIFGMQLESQGGPYSSGWGRSPNYHAGSSNP